MDATRKRHERQIRKLDRFVGGEYEFFRAMHNAAADAPGLSWFTDEQLADIRERMIRADWFRHKLNRENRKRRIA